MVNLRLQAFYFILFVYYEETALMKIYRDDVMGSLFSMSRASTHTCLSKVLCASMTKSVSATVTVARARTCFYSNMS